MPRTSSSSKRPTRSASCASSTHSEHAAAASAALAAPLAAPSPTHRPGHVNGSGHPRGTNSGYIDGRFHAPASIGRGWKALSDAFELTGTRGRRITFHDLRHSFATRAIAEGADVKAVAAVLGHSNAAIALNVYADTDPESKQRTVDLISRSVAERGEVRPFAELVEVQN